MRQYRNRFHSNTDHTRRIRTGRDVKKSDAYTHETHRTHAVCIQRRSFTVSGYSIAKTKFSRSLLTQWTLFFFLFTCRYCLSRLVCNLYGYLKVCLCIHLVFSFFWCCPLLVRRGVKCAMQHQRDTNTSNMYVV